MITLTDYRIVPVSGGGVCVLGLKEGQAWQTTRLSGSGPGKVLTESGTIYALAQPHASLWELQLQLKRPDEYKKLRDTGML